MKNLLEFLFSVVKVDYISDLKRGEKRTLAIKQLLTLKEDEFPVEQWRDAVEYLLEISVSQKSIQEIKKILMDSIS